MTQGLESDGVNLLSSWGPQKEGSAVAAFWFLLSPLPGYGGQELALLRYKGEKMGSSGVQVASPLQTPQGGQATGSLHSLQHAHTWYWHPFSLLVTSYLSLPWTKYTTWWKDPRLDTSTFYGGGSSLNSKPEKSVPFLPGHLDPCLQINKSLPNKIMLVFLSLNIYLLSSFIIGTFEILYRIITIALYIYITFSSQEIQNIHRYCLPRSQFLYCPLDREETHYYLIAYKWCLFSMRGKDIFNKGWKGKKWQRRRHEKMCP